ncbi:hypothetical protein IQ273_09685 [Nodosilinea sp. LEGE 07298]|uniref:hypothetical protein n=1 Tax=Nodosilinea sp. LEGE 07298 TaxID=2777970 RepID=UPI0018827352|nr:hypothetical protein [Nodosilinea sp. LEGE 07298]MBE9109684.1 hypothetical protein [Nodosilinea sp. LEGE 07298]
MTSYKTKKRESVKYKKLELNKYGFFQSEKEVFEEVARKTGLIQLGSGGSAWWCRHPLAFLVEAADDICYRIMDLEDGFNMGYIDYQTTKNLLIDVAGERYRSNLIHGINLSENRENIRFLRGKAINKLIDVAERAFTENEEGLLTGEFDESLLDQDKELKDKIKNIKKEIKDKVYNCQEVLSVEIAGYNVISTLMEEFIASVNGDLSIRDQRNKKSAKVKQILPGKALEEQMYGEKYLNTLRVLDYLSGMTDSYAVALFKQIQGIALPGNR